MDCNWCFYLPVIYIRLSKLWGYICNSTIFHDLFNNFNINFNFIRFLVDKFTSRKIIPFMNIPLLFGLLILYYFDFKYSAYLFFGFMGVSNGLANVLGSSTWAEIYGVRYLGSIRALTTAFMVFSTAFGTAIFGILIDRGYTIEFIALISIIYISISLLALLTIKRSIEPIIISKKT